MKPGETGIKRIIHAAGYSYQGLIAAYRQEAAFRQETWLFLASIPLALVLGNNWVEVVAMTGVLLLVMIVEILNSAIEAVVDRVGHEVHPLSGQAKDMGSAAVFMSLVLAATVWIAIIWG